jgi:hypothetical protein
MLRYFHDISFRSVALTTTGSVSLAVLTASYFLHQNDRKRFSSAVPTANMTVDTKVKTPFQVRMSGEKIYRGDLKSARGGISSE